MIGIIAVSKVCQAGCAVNQVRRGNEQVADK